MSITICKGIFDAHNNVKIFPVIDFSFSARSREGSGWESQKGEGTTSSEGWDNVATP
jgi:hypothetical protein